MPPERPPNLRKTRPNPSIPPRVFEPDQNGQLRESGPIEVDFGKIRADITEALEDLDKSKKQPLITHSVKAPTFEDPEKQDKIIETFCELCRKKLGSGFSENNSTPFDFCYNDIQCRVSVIASNGLRLVYGVEVQWKAYFNSNNEYQGFRKLQTDPLKQTYPSDFFEVLLAGMRALNQA